MLREVYLMTGAPVLATMGEPMITGNAVQSLPATVVQTQHGNASTTTETSQSLGLSSSNGDVPAPPNPAVSLEVSSQDRQPDGLLLTPKTVHKAPSPDKTPSPAESSKAGDTPSPAKGSNPGGTSSPTKGSNPGGTPSPTKGLKRGPSALSSNDPSSPTTTRTAPRSKCPTYWKLPVCSTIEPFLQPPT